MILCPGMFCYCGFLQLAFSVGAPMLLHPAYHSFGRLPDVHFSTRTGELIHDAGLLVLGKAVLGLCEYSS